MKNIFSKKILFKRNGKDITPHAASLLELDCVASTVTDGNQPLTSEVLAEATLEDASHRDSFFSPRVFGQFGLGQRKPRGNQK